MTVRCGTELAKRGLTAVLGGLLALDISAQAADLPDEQFETIPADETGQIEETAALGVRLQTLRAKNDKTQDGQLLRGVHAKSHGCVKAEFTINADIDRKYRVGLFAQPGTTYEAWIRYSNASVLREDDLKANDAGQRQNGSRGMALKIMNVDGPMLSLDNGRRNQDFLMINTPEFAFANVRDYLRLNRILERSPKGDVAKPYFLPAAFMALGQPEEGEPAAKAAKREALRSIIAGDPLLRALSSSDIRGTVASAQVAGKIARKTVRNPMQVQYFGAAPFLFGHGRAMKFSASPCTATPQPPFTEITAENPPKNYLRAALAKTMSGKSDVCYDFGIQTRNVGTGGLNIEDATKTWPDEVDSYVSAARITIRVPQSPLAPNAVASCEKLAFTPWHSLAVHRPLGGINRLRRKVYSDSASHRGADGY